MSKQVESLAPAPSSDGLPSVTGIAGDVFKDLAHEAWSLKGPLGTLALLKHPGENILDPLKTAAQAIRHPIDTAKALPENVMAKFTSGRELLAGWVQEHAPTVVNNVEEDGKIVAEDAGGAAKTVVGDVGGAARAAGPAVEGAAKVVGGAAKAAAPVVGDIAEGAAEVLEAVI
jgi:hypothetical protein